MQNNRHDNDSASGAALISERILVAAIAIGIAAIIGPVLEYSLERRAVQTMVLEEPSSDD